ncbi:MAG: biotin--[acetyl-CoA-carboxylase] ligase [Micromonosporaceae bacterium]
MGSHPGRVPLPVAELRRAVIAAGGPWTRLDVVDSTGSTNDDLVAAARAGEPEGRVLVAEHQRAGRGRSGRRWVSPPRAGLAVSVLLRPGAPGGGTAGVPTSRWGWLPMLTGVALAEAVGRVTGLAPALKWPNDLLVDGRKCAGILAEATGDAVVVGVGVNVTLREDELPPVPPGAPPATSLALAGAACTDRARLLRDLLDRLGSWYGRWRDAAGDADRCGLRAAYLAGCDTVGRTVRVELPGGGELVGRAETVDDAGRLVVTDASGHRTAVAAGDVRHVRPHVRPG